MHLAGAAGALKRLIDQHAQDLVLGLARHVGDFVDEQRAAMGFFQCAGLARLLAVALLDPEQFDFHPLRRDRGSVDDDKRPFGAPEAWCSVRAASSLPEPEGPTIRMRAVGLGGPLDGLAQLVSCRRIGRSEC